MYFTRTFKCLLFITTLILLNGCYEISKVAGIKEVAMTGQEVIGTFSIKLIDEEQTLQSIDLFSEQSLTNVMVKAIDADVWLPIDSIGTPLKNNATTQFEVMADIAHSDTASLEFQLTNFTLVNDSSTSNIDPTILSYSMTAYKVDNLFSQSVEISIGERAESVDSADINGDGLADLVVTAGSGLYIYLQSEEGGLEEPRILPLSNTRPESLKLDDINNDGRVDILVACYGSGIDLFIQTEGVEFTPSKLTTNLSLALDTGDFNNDGLTDIVNIGWSQKEANIYYQTVSGEFDQQVYSPVNYSGYNDVVVADMNGDSRDDIVVMNGQTYDVPNFNIMYQTETGMGIPEYYDLGYNENSNGIGVGDINDDGLMDVILSHGGNRPYSYVSVFTGLEEGTLAPAESMSSYEIPDTLRIADINQDGRMDIIVSHAGWSKIGTYIQKPDGTMREEVLYNSAYSNFGRDSLSIADINHDGILDVVSVGNYNSFVIHYGK